MFLELAPQSTHQSGNVCWDTFSNVSCRVTGWVVWCDAIYQETVRMCQQLYTIYTTFFSKLWFNI